MKYFISIIAILIISFSIAFKFNRTVRVVSLILLHDFVYSSTKFKVDGDKVYMNGYICRFTPDQLKKVLTENPEVKTIVLESVMGSLDDASNFPMGEFVREKGLNTYLKSDSRVASGGTDFFLSGVNRTMEEGAYIGVHSWEGVSESRTIEAKDIPKDDVQHKANAKYVENMLETEDFYWYTIYAAPADGMHQMTKEEIIKYNVATRIIEKKEKK